MANSYFRTWKAYQLSYGLSQSIFRMTRTFPPEEKFKLADQIIRSSRSVYANLAECYGRRNYLKHYQSKLADCVSENFETQAWLDTAKDLGYINTEQHNAMATRAEEVGRLLTYMQRNPSRFTPLNMNKRTNRRQASPKALKH